MQPRVDFAGFDSVPVHDIKPVRALSAGGGAGWGASRGALGIAHCGYPSAAPAGRHACYRFLILFIWLTIRRRKCPIGAGLCSRRLRRGVLGERCVRRVAEQGVGRHAHAAPLIGGPGGRGRRDAGRLFGQFQLLPSTPLAQGQPPAMPPVPETTLGTGQVKVALILPLSAAGNAGIAGQAMRNAADMALAEFKAPNIQLLVKDDGGSGDGARLAAQQALDEGAEIILGPLFAQSVGVVGQIARSRNIPVIAFSTDANVASRGVYLLSFLPESDVSRIVQYATSNGKRSFAVLIPDNPYGTVVEAAFKQEVARRGGQIVALEHYPHDKVGMSGPVRNVAQAAARADALLIPDGGDALPDIAQVLVASGVNTKKLQLLGTGFGTIREFSRHRHLMAAGMPRRTARVIGISPAGTRRASSSSRCAPRRSLTTRSRSSPRW